MDATTSPLPTTSPLSAPTPFAARHLGPAAADREEMLTLLGAASLEDLVRSAVPAGIRLDRPLDLPAPLTEPEALAALRELAERNRPFRSLLGQGFHGTVLPPVLQRNVLENPGWYTAYTPYQPEISQGRLEALLVFQTMVADLTGLPLANASLLDEASAAAEAMLFCRRVSRVASDTFVVDEDCHPSTIAVLETRAWALGIKLVLAEPGALADGVDGFGVLLQYPGSSGALRDLRPAIAAAKEKGAMVAVAADPLALCLLTPPGELGADVAIGSTQRFGVPMFYGGPHAAYFATREEHARQLPGRLVGVTVDAEGRPALRLALQTREQHIRRERATSNICTAQVLLAVMAGMYAAWHGPEGLAAIASRVARLTSALAAAAPSVGAEPLHTTVFDTLRLRVDDPGAVLEAASARGLNLARVDEGTVGVTLDECSTPAEVAAVLEALAAGRGPVARGGDVPGDGAGIGSSGALGAGSGAGGVADEAAVRRLADEAEPAVPPALRRTSPFLTHPVFQRYHTETEMMRYLRRLADADLALDRAMIPLGSCTMKLNSAAELAPITWPELAELHPFVPEDQAAGTLAMIADLERWLAEVTGYAAVSLQPNAGSQGELTGLLVIRRYHEARGEGGRDVCLIPSSAHGTNAASATLAGYRVVVVACRPEDGAVDLADLEAKAAANADRLAAAMVTYPSTHGVFEEGIVEVCDIVHRHGGQVYLDGANLNALVGVAKPGWFGSDVSHLNLHKTFCIPHGGGGPGVGPVAVASHLAPFLPGRSGEGAGATGPVGPVAAAPHGSAGVLPISWAYIRMMGPEGLRLASEVAILNANYVAARLGGAYPILYVGANGRVAHECILDLRPLTAASGVTVEDVAKRLIDYGFHAPTMSFPVAGTLMVEPTESESKAELDRFCDAMLAIRAEIAAVERGEVRLEQSPLRHAPHTALALTAEVWDRPYSRREGGWPAGVPAGGLGSGEGKYWPPVARVDNAYGDRHLACTCPPMEAYEEGSEGAGAGPR